MKSNKVLRITLIAMSILLLIACITIYTLLKAQDAPRRDITSTKAGSLFALNMPIDKAITKGNELFKMEKQEIDEDFYKYVFSRNDSVKFEIVPDNNDKVNNIFIYDNEYFTDDSISVGSTFGDIFSKHPNAILQLGEDGEFVVANGIIYLHEIDTALEPSKIAGEYTAENDYESSLINPGIAITTILLTNSR